MWPPRCTCQALHQPGFTSYRAECTREDRCGRGGPNVPPPWRHAALSPAIQGTNGVVSMLLPAVNAAPGISAPSNQAFTRRPADAETGQAEGSVVCRECNSQGPSSTGQPRYCVDKRRQHAFGQTTCTRETRVVTYFLGVPPATSLAHRRKVQGRVTRRAR
jgi:hypothetical protein